MQTEDVVKVMPSTAWTKTTRWQPMTMRSQKTEAAPSPDLDEEFLRDAQALCDFIKSVADGFEASLSKPFPLPITGKHKINLTEEKVPRTATECLSEEIKESMFDGVMRTDIVAGVKAGRRARLDLK